MPNLVLNWSSPHIWGTILGPKFVFAEPKTLFYNSDYIKHVMAYFLSRKSNTDGKKLLNDGFKFFLQSSSCGKSYTENFSSSLVNFGPCSPYSGSVCTAQPQLVSDLILMLIFSAISRNAAQFCSFSSADVNYQVRSSRVRPRSR